MLRTLCLRHGRRLAIVEGESDSSQLVSSSRIRGLLASGEVKAANRLLVEPYRLRGIVARGAGPRTNHWISYRKPFSDPRLIPLRRFTPDENRRRKFLSGGHPHWSNPTFGESAVKVEVHLLDFDGDLYGAFIEVELLERLRTIESFAGPDALIKQLRIDIERAREIASPAVHGFGPLFLVTNPTIRGTRPNHYAILCRFFSCLCSMKWCSYSNSPSGLITSASTRTVLGTNPYCRSNLQNIFLTLSKTPRAIKVAIVRRRSLLKETRPGAREVMGLVASITSQSGSLGVCLALFR